MTATAHYPRGIHSSKQPLTLDQIRDAAPSAFAVQPYHAMSQRYSHIPTSAVIDGMISAGFQPFAAKQSATRVDDKREHTKHMIRFRAAGSVVSVGDVFPEVVLINSHDGTSAYKLMAGMFRLQCLNGLVIADSMINSINIRHSGNVIEQVATGSVEIVDHIPETIDAIARWKQIQLSQAEQNAFAEAAHVVRFADADGHVDTPIQPAQLLRPRRWDDNGTDLWSTFNRVQENVIRGGIKAYRPGSTQRTSTREVKGIDQDVRLNRALWTLTENMAALKN